MSVLVREHFVELDGVTVRQDSSNAWTLTIPLSPTVCRRTRRRASIEDWDQAVFLLDDLETAPAVATEAGANSITVSVWG